MRKNKFKQLGDPIKFKNVTPEKKFNPVRKYYSTVQVGDKSYILTYECGQRSEAKVVFEEESRVIGGRLDKHIGVLK